MEPKRQLDTLHTLPHDRTTAQPAMAESIEPMSVDGEAAVVDQGSVDVEAAGGAPMEEEKEEDACRWVLCCGGLQ